MRSFTSSKLQLHSFLSYIMLYARLNPVYVIGAIESAKTLKLGLVEPAINWVLMMWAASYESIIINERTVQKVLGTNELTFKKSLHSPWSTGPSLLPSNSTNLIPVPDFWATSSLSFSKSSSVVAAPPPAPPSLSLAIHLISASGASTKHVKWSSVFSSGAVWLSFEDADSVWTLAKRGVEERILARSNGVLSFV